MSASSGKDSSLSTTSSSSPSPEPVAADEGALGVEATAEVCSRSLSAVTIGFTLRPAVAGVPPAVTLAETLTLPAWPVAVLVRVGLGLMLFGRFVRESVETSFMMLSEVGGLVTVLVALFFSMGERDLMESDLALPFLSVEVELELELELDLVLKLELAEWVEAASFLASYFCLFDFPVIVGDLQEEFELILRFFFNLAKFEKF